MKANQLILLSATAFLTSIPWILNYPSAHAVSPTDTSTESSLVVAQNRSPAGTLSGSFMAAEHPTTGTARIVTENGRRYLVLDSAFRTSNQGPDLHVILDPAEKPPQMYQDPSRYVNLGKLQKFNGEQRYPIPAAINLANFKSVAIWCRMANATFGYAPLGGSASSARTQAK